MLECWGSWDRVGGGHRPFVKGWVGRESCFLSQSPAMVVRVRERPVCWSLTLSLNKQIDQGLYPRILELKSGRVRLRTRFSCRKAWSPQVTGSTLLGFREARSLEAGRLRSRSCHHWYELSDSRCSHKYSGQSVPPWGWLFLPLKPNSSVTGGG